MEQGEPRYRDAWTEVGRRIRNRINELQLTQAEAIRRSGVSDKTLTGYMDGKPIHRRDKRRGLCQALGWTPDSIDRILDGLDPLPADDPATYPDPGLEARVSELERRYARLLEDHRHLQAEVAELRQTRPTAKNTEVTPYDWVRPSEWPEDKWQRAVELIRGYEERRLLREVLPAVES